MPKKIDDILNPKLEPDLIQARLLGILRKARTDELALTRQELFSADRFDWLQLAPVGEGGVLLSIAAALIDTELGVRKTLDELREQALDELLEAGRVLERVSDGQAYYWLATTDAG